MRTQQYPLMLSQIYQSPAETGFTYVAALCIHIKIDIYNLPQNLILGSLLLKWLNTILIPQDHGAFLRYNNTPIQWWNLIRWNLDLLQSGFFIFSRSGYHRHSSVIWKLNNDGKSVLQNINNSKVDFDFSWWIVKLCTNHNSNSQLVDSEGLVLKHLLEVLPVFFCIISDLQKW